jgi:hypothetical protein
VEEKEGDNKEIDKMVETIILLEKRVEDLEYFRKDGIYEFIKTT